jgi:hypothetical protein
MLGVSRSSCMACEGAGVVHFKQHKCRRCNGAGATRSGPCALCEGRCYLAFEHAPCSQCNGTGKLSGWLSSSVCTGCETTPGYIMLSRLDIASDDSDSLGSDTADGDTTVDHSEEEGGGPRPDHPDFAHYGYGRHTPRHPSDDDGSAYADDESHRDPTPRPHRSPPHRPPAATRRSWLCHRHVVVPAIILALFLLYRLSRIGLERDQ